MKKKIPFGGFTLVEVVVFMAIFSVILTVLMQMFGMILEKQAETESTSAVESDANVVLSRLVYDIKRATAITTPSVVGGTSSSLAITVGGSAYTYALGSGNLRLTTPLGTDQINSMRTTVTSLSFSRIGNTGGKNSIKVAFTIRSIFQKTSGYETKSISTTIGTR